MHLSLAFLWVNPQGAQGDDTVLVFLFSLQGGELYSFGNSFAGPRDLFESWSMVGPIVKSPIKPILD